MVPSLNMIWFVILIFVLGVLCTAFLMSAPVFWALILLAVVIGLIFTTISLVNKRRQVRQHRSEEAALLEYLRVHGIGGELSELAGRLGFTEETALQRLLSLEERGLVPPGSAKSMRRNS